MSVAALDIKLIDLGGDVGEVKLVSWHVAVGDKVSRGDLLYTVESEKVAIEVESEYDGKIVELLAAEGELVGPDRPLLKISPNGPAATT